ncbi:MAG: alanine--tRNA ligase [Desulfatiglans sp.]|jgi:alanyl-tRNA synthetase|nr:alanine--tRNA ligase [Desulfatiglans sp.]
MNFREIRQKFLDYFRKRGHEIVESSHLVPKDDPTLLFTNAGMVQFKRLFLGQAKKPYSRAASSQKCIRAGGKHNDLENVGYTPRHHTFFEMLGNFSFGDYFKEEAILWAWELLTEGYGLPGDKLYISVFRDDDEAYRIWEDKVGVTTERIVRLGEKDNFWAMGDTGPCGPCSEIHIDQGPSMGCGRQDCSAGCDCDRYLEIWNLVFTQFDRDKEGKLVPLPKPNIDTGMGLERIAAVVQGKRSNYEADIFHNIISRIEELSGKNYGREKKQDVAFRVVADHARSVAFLIGDGVMPSNEGRGYVLRRIIRRAVRYGQTLGLENPFFSSVSEAVIEDMGEDYVELVRSRNLIKGVMENEEKRFADTLYYSTNLLNEELAQLKSDGQDTIPGELIFKLYDTYGLSVDIVEDVARDEGFYLDMAGYEKAMARQKALSQESWKGSGEQDIPEALRNFLARGITTIFEGYRDCDARAKVLGVLVDGRETTLNEIGHEADIILDRTPFYGETGGQVGDTGWFSNGPTRFFVSHTLRLPQDLIVHRGHLEAGSLSVGDEVDAHVDRDKRRATAANHSATHLLHAALREVLGDHVKQAGSLVSSERLRFDFSHFTRLSPEQIMEVEGRINQLIRDNRPVRTEEMSRDDAMNTGAMAIFEERYGDRVRRVSIGDVSKELCGGTHTKRTGDIGLFRIISEGAVAANVRRIEALTGKVALLHDQKQGKDLDHLSSLLKTAPDKVGERVERLLNEAREREKEIESLKLRLLSKKSEEFLEGVKEINGVKVTAFELEADNPKELREAADRMRDKLKSGIILASSRGKGKVMLICVVTKDLVGRYDAGRIIKELSGIVGGKGGGRPDMAQGGGSRPEELDRAVLALYDFIGRES